MTEEASVTPKKGRGRPKKSIVNEVDQETKKTPVKGMVESSDEQDTDDGEKVSPPVTPKSASKKRQPDPEPEEAPEPKRGRGRPRKYPKDPNAVKKVPAVRGRGRPRKNKNK